MDYTRLKIHLSLAQLQHRCVAILNQSDLLYYIQLVTLYKTSCHCYYSGEARVIRLVRYKKIAQ